MAKQLKTAEFDAVVNEAPLAMIDFWAVWCGPCKMLSPAVEDIAERYGDKTLRSEIEGNQEAMLALVRRYFHCG